MTLDEQAYRHGVLDGLGLRTIEFTLEETEIIQDALKAELRRTNNAEKTAMIKKMLDRIEKGE